MHPQPLEEDAQWPCLHLFNEYWWHVSPSDVDCRFEAISEHVVRMEHIVQLRGVASQTLCYVLL